MRHTLYFTKIMWTMIHIFFIAGCGNNLKNNKVSNQKASLERKADQKAVESTNDYFVGFAVRTEVSSGTTHYPGHAFVVFGRGTPLACSQNGNYEAYGFYGSANNNLDYFIGNVQGLLLSEYVVDPTLFYSIKVSFDEYLKALMVKDNFIQTTRDYNLYKHNCVSYVDAVAKTIPNKIKRPDASQFPDIPITYLRKLIELNKL